MSTKRTRSKTIIPPPRRQHAGVHAIQELVDDLACAYERGRQFHNRAQQAARGGGKVKMAVLYQAVARDLGVSPSQLKKDAGFAAAVDKIVEHCGEHARKVLLGGRHNLTTEKVEGLSRKAPPMQMAQIASLSKRGRLQEWRSYSELVWEMYPDPVGHRSRTPPSAHPVQDAPPVETWDYGEVIDRLRRAGGLVAKNVVDVPRVDDRLTPEVRAQLLDSLDFLEHCSGLLRLFVQATEGRP